MRHRIGRNEIRLTTWLVTPGEDPVPALELGTGSPPTVDTRTVHCYGVRYGRGPWRLFKRYRDARASLGELGD